MPHAIGADDSEYGSRLRHVRRIAIMYNEDLTPVASLAENPHDAYRLECYLWHAQGGAWARIEGDAHPAPAEPIPFLGCPDCEE